MRFCHFSKVDIIEWKEQWREEAGRRGRGSREGGGNYSVTDPVEGVLGSILFFCNISIIIEDGTTNSKIIISQFGHFGEDLFICN